MTYCYRDDDDTLRRSVSARTKTPECLHAHFMLTYTYSTLRICDVAVTWRIRIKLYYRLPLYYYNMHWREATNPKALQYLRTLSVRVNNNNSIISTSNEFRDNKANKGFFFCCFLFSSGVKIIYFAALRCRPIKCTALYDIYNRVWVISIW